MRKEDSSIRAVVVAPGRSGSEGDVAEAIPTEISDELDEKVPIIVAIAG